MPVLTFCVYAFLCSFLLSLKIGKQVLHALGLLQQAKDKAFPLHLSGSYTAFSATVNTVGETYICSSTEYCYHQHERLVTARTVASILTKTLAAGPSDDV